MGVGCPPGDTKRMVLAPLERWPPACLATAERSRLAGVPAARCGAPAEPRAVPAASGVMELRAAGVGGRELSDRRFACDAAAASGVAAACSAPAQALLSYCTSAWYTMTGSECLHFGTTDASREPKQSVPDNVREFGRALQSHTIIGKPSQGPGLCQRHGAASCAKVHQ